MGFELEQFVDPDHISPELICPICCGVLERPVQTATEHLFCEDELLEWMERSDQCTVTNTPLDPKQIKKPSRIIMNILGGLTSKCSNRGEGCTWTGKLEQLHNHLVECQFRPRNLLRNELEAKTKELSESKQLVRELRKKVAALEQENAVLRENTAILERQLKVYDAFVKDERVPMRREPSADSSSPGSESDLQKINRLRLLESKLPGGTSSSQK